MSLCVFVGPTLPIAEARTVLDAIYLPAARQGDVYRAVSLLGPRAIGIVDGYFQWSPAVWHKEILWAIDQGVDVFGAASMGALRAAELAPFGMRGVGRVFEAYRDGVLAGAGDEPFEDDDEVAVVHGPAESGYVAGSEAMVNIRCTLAAAVREGVIDEATRVHLLAVAKPVFFPERSYSLLLERGRAAGLPEAALAALERWLPSGRINQKRIDAVAMLESMREFVAGRPPRARAGFAFERTTLWERAVARLQPAAAFDPVEATVLDELRLDAGQHDALRREALRSLIGIAESGGDATPISHDPDAACGEGERLVERAARREAVRRLQAEMPAALVECKLLALLRERGSFERLRARAERKRACLATLPQVPEIDDFSELQLLELRDWYFASVAGAEMPDDLDQWLRESGYADLARFHRSIFAEYLYRGERCGEEATAELEALRPQAVDG